jgi:hypothetical protein
MFVGTVFYTFDTIRRHRRRKHNERIINRWGRE